jgi:hypothetical protein
VDDKELENVKIPIWIIIVMVIATILSLAVLIVMLQNEFELEKVFYFIIAVLVTSIFATIFYFIKKAIMKSFKRNKVEKTSSKINKGNVYSETNIENQASDFNSDNNVKLAKKEKNELKENLGGNNRSDIFRY